MLRIGFRIDTNVVAGRGASRTNALPIHARCRSGTRIVAHAAMRVARHFIDAIRTACVLRRARTRSRLTYGKARTRGVFVEHPIAVIILAVAFLHCARKGCSVVVVAIHSATNDGRLTIVVFVERRKRANRRGQIAMDIRLAWICPEFLNARRVVGANRDLHASLPELTKFSRRTRRRATVRSDNVLAHVHRARVNGTVETIIAIGGIGTTPCAPSTSHTSRTSHASRTARAAGIARVAAARTGARTGARIAPLTARRGCAISTTRCSRRFASTSHHDASNEGADAQRDGEQVFDVLHVQTPFSILLRLCRAARRVPLLR